MRKLLLGSAFAIATLTGSPVLAADVDFAPISDWSGIYGGVFAAAISVDGDFDGVCSCQQVYTDLEHSGIGYGMGLLLGVNYQMDNVVLGIEGDWAFGLGDQATNDEPGIDTKLKFEDIATLRARAGFLSGDTLFYVTGGAAAVNIEFDAVMTSRENDNQWAYGWTAGAGIEHAFSDHFHARLEYLFIDLPNQKFSLTDSASTTLDADQHFKSVQMVRAGLTYNFPW